MKVLNLFVCGLPAPPGDEMNWNSLSKVNAGVNKYQQIDQSWLIIFNHVYI